MRFHVTGHELIGNRFDPENHNEPSESVRD
jgi:hypothetical protein